MTDSDQSIRPIFSDDPKGYSAEYWVQQYNITRWALDESSRLHRNEISSAKSRVRELEAANATLTNERDELARQLEQARKAMTLADVGSLEELIDWIVGAQSEIANLGGQLRDIWDMQAAYMRGEVPINKITIGYISESDETPFGQMLDGLGDEVEP